MIAQRLPSHNRIAKSLMDLGRQPFKAGSLFWFAFSLLLSLAQPGQAQPVTAPKTEASSARELYSQAARCLVTKDLAQASRALSQLIEQHPQDDMAPLAAMRLAQCHLGTGKNSEAIAVLEKWIPELAKSTRSRALDPAAELEAQALLARAYLATGKHEQVIKLSQQNETLGTNPSAQSQAQQRALQQIKAYAAAAGSRREAGQADALRQAARHVREKQYTLAQTELDKVDTGLLSPDWMWRYHVLGAQCQLGSGQPKHAIEILNRIELASLQPKEQNLVRMLRMEAALTSGALVEAEKELNALTVTSLGDEQQTAMLDLRRAELALLRKDRNTVESLARSAKEKYPNFESLHEFDLMLARNCLARIEFDEARKILQAVVRNPPANDSTAVPRAQWLLGESYLLSQDYQHAIEHYSCVIDGKQARQWIESALMQRGRCYESLGQVAAARSDFQRLADEFPQSRLLDDAKTRMSQLTSGSSSLK